DFLVGARGADSIQGNDGDDATAWSNGDGSDVMDGNAGDDLVQVNGALGADDVFTVAPGAADRLAFNRLSPGPFSLDIATVETLTVAGASGNDTFTVNSLAGASSPSTIRLAGFDGNDTFFVTPDAAAQIFATGNQPGTAPGDTLNVNTGGT